MYVCLIYLCINFLGETKKANQRFHMDCFQRSFFVQARCALIFAQKTTLKATSETNVRLA